MRDQAPFSRLENQFKITEIASWTFVSVLVVLVQSHFIHVQSPFVLNLAFALFLALSFFIHRWLPRRVPIEKCLVYESLVFLFFTTLLIHFTGGAQSPFWLLFYMPIMISLVVLETRFCLVILSLIAALSLFEMAKAFMKGALNELPILILNIFCLVALTALGYFLIRLVIQEKALKDVALQERERALKERDQTLKLVQDKSQQVEEYSQRLAQINRELMTQQAQLLHLTEDLERVNQDLKRLDQIKSDFVSMVSHELRTPLTSIKESVSLLLEDAASPLTQEQKKFLKITQHNVQRLSTLIQDVLDFSKLESGTMKMKKEKVEIGALVQHACEFDLGMVEEKNIRLRFALPKDALFVYADSSRLRQILDNFISNAVKFTAEGGLIEVSIEKMGRDSVLDSLQKWGADQELFNARQMGQLALWRNFITLSVRDTGVGISRADLNRIFERFLQLEVHEKRPRGTGLGLAIVKQLVLAHEGGLWVESKVGEGSSFRVCLPVYEEAVEISEELGRWARRVHEIQKDGMLILLDFMDSGRTDKAWQEMVHEMNGIERLIRTAAPGEDQGIYRIGGSQILIVSLEVDHEESLKILEKVRTNIHESQWKDRGFGLRFSLWPFSWSQVSQEGFWQQVERMMQEVRHGS